MSSKSNNNWWIWKVFWILLVVTGVEVILGIIKPPFLHNLCTVLYASAKLNICSHEPRSVTTSK